MRRGFMQPTQKHRSRLVSARATAVAAVVVLGAIVGRTAADESQANQLTFSNQAGVHRTVTTANAIDVTNPFFQDLGTNDRSCFTCHRPAQAWTVTPGEL